MPTSQDMFTMNPDRPAACGPYGPEQAAELHLTGRNWAAVRRAWGAVLVVSCCFGVRLNRQSKRSRDTTEL